MQAFHNDPAIAEKYIARVKAHAAADEIIKGTYWHDGKGCAVGCTIHGNNHMAYEDELGVPVMLARLEDRLFEGMPNARAKKFPLEFMEAINFVIGKDLSLAGWKFLYWNLTENLVLADSDNPKAQASIIKCRAAIKQCADVLKPLTKGSLVDASAASAAWSAKSAAESAAESAESAAWSAAWSAKSAAESAAESAASAAESAASAAWSAAESAAYENMANNLLEIIRAA